MQATQKLSGRVELASKFDKSSTQKTSKRSNTSLTSSQVVHKSIEQVHLKLQPKGIEEFSRAKKLLQSDQEATEESYRQVRPDANRWNKTTNISKQIFADPDHLPQKQIKVAKFPTRITLNESSLDFAFFDKVYLNYNTIWQQVLKLNIQGELQNLVSFQSFERILAWCNVIDNHENAFCRFLLLTCLHKSQIDGELLIDFRLFFNSVFQMLKRKRADDPQVNFVNAELFVIDHFWSCMLTRDSSLKEGYAYFNDFKACLFEFFNSTDDPLLHIHEIEQILTASIAYLQQQNKRKDIISKKTCRKVVYKGYCSKMFINALLRGSVQTQTHHSIQTSSHLINDQRRLTISSSNKRLAMSENRADQKGQIDTQINSQNLSLSVASRPCSLGTGGIGKDQKDVPQQQLKPVFSPTKKEISIGTQSKIEKQGQQFQAFKQKKPLNLCRQLEASIVGQKLESAINRAQKRVAFFMILLDALESKNQPHYRSVFERDSLEEQPNPNRKSASLRSPASPNLISHGFKCDQIGEYDCSNFQRPPLEQFIYVDQISDYEENDQVVTDLRDQVIIDSRESNEMIKLQHLHSGFLETESEPEQTEHNETTSGGASERVNTHILSSLIETENQNTRCLKALEERIQSLEQSGFRNKVVKNYDISTDSLQEVTKRTVQQTKTNSMLYSQKGTHVTSDTSAGHVPQHIVEVQAQSVHSYDSIKAKPDLKRKEQKLEKIISRNSYAKLVQTFGDNDLTNVTKKYDQNLNEESQLGSRHLSSAKKVQELSQLEKLQRNRDRLFKQAADRQQSIETQSVDSDHNRSIKSRSSHQRRETFNQYLDGELQLIQDPRSMGNSIVQDQSISNSIHDEQAEREEDFVAQQLDDYGDEMDFEANKEQRPRQTPSDFGNDKNFSSVDCPKDSLMHRQSYGNEIKHYQSQDPYREQNGCLANQHPYVDSVKTNPLDLPCSITSCYVLSSHTAQSTKQADLLQIQNDAREQSLQRLQDVQAKQLQHYIKKYKKFKQKTRVLMKNKNDELERADRLTSYNEQLVCQNEMLQKHLTQTVESAQEMESQLNQTNLYHVLDKVMLIRSRQDFFHTFSSLRGAFTTWYSLSTLHSQKQQAVSQLQKQKERSQKHSVLLKWQKHLYMLRSNRYSVMLQKRQLVSIVKRKRQRTMQHALRMWFEWLRINDRVTEMQTMELMQQDFNEVVTHLNKFRVQLSFQKLFGVLQSAKDRTMLSSLSKLQQYGLVSKVFKQGQVINSFRQQVKDQQKEREVQERKRETEQQRERAQQRKKEIQQQTDREAQEHKREIELLKESEAQQRRREAERPQVDHQRYRDLAQNHSQHSRDIHRERDQNKEPARYAHQKERGYPPRDMHKESDQKPEFQDAARALRDQPRKGATPHSCEKVQLSESFQYKRPQTSSQDLKKNDMSRSYSQTSIFSSRAVLLRNQSKHIEAFANLHTVFRLQEMKQVRRTLKNVFDYLQVVRRAAKKPLLSPRGFQQKDVQKQRMGNSQGLGSNGSVQTSSIETNIYKYPSTSNSNMHKAFISTGFINSQSSGQIIIPQSYTQDNQMNGITLSSSNGGFGSSSGLNMRQDFAPMRQDFAVDRDKSLREARGKLQALSQERVLLEQRQQQIESQKQRLFQERQMRKLQLREELEQDIIRSSRNNLEAPRILQVVSPNVSNISLKQHDSRQDKKAYQKERSRSPVSSFIDSNNSSTGGLYLNTTKRTHSTRPPSLGGRSGNVSPRMKKRWNV